MRRPTTTLIENLRSRAEVLRSQATFESLGFVHDHLLMEEAANRLQAVEVLEQQLQAAQQQIDALRGTSHSKEMWEAFDQS